MTQSDAVRLSPDIRYRTVTPEGVVVHLKRAEVMVVNELGVKILELIEKTGSLSGVIDLLSQTYDAPRDRIAADVQQFCNDMRNRGLLE